MFCLDIISANIYVRKSTSNSAGEKRCPFSAGAKAARFISLYCLQELKSTHLSLGRGCACEKAKLCRMVLLWTDAQVPHG